MSDPSQDKIIEGEQTQYVVKILFMWCIILKVQHFLNQNVVLLFFGKYFTITLRRFKNNVVIVPRKGTKYKSI